MFKGFLHEKGAVCFFANGPLKKRHELYHA